MCDIYLVIYPYFNTLSSLFSTIFLDKVPFDLDKIKFYIIIFQLYMSYSD